MTWCLRRLVVVGFCFASSFGVAQAHPLGNFTINHLAQVVPSRGAIAIAYTLDIAEIPTFQIVHATGTPWDAAQLRRWAREEASLVATGLTVEVDGRAQPLAARDASARFRPGAGGLPTLYWQARFDVPVARGTEHRVSIEDRVYADRRIGWKDVTVAPQTEPTHALTTYPGALIGSPRHNDAATFVLTPDGTAASVAVREDESADFASLSPIVRSGYLSDLFARSDQSVWLVCFTVLIAFGLGALHGLEPGHGKALLAFTLVGARATVKQAGILALALTFAHTIAVLLLGIALFFFADFASESIFAWIALLSGIAVAVVGARSLSSAVARAAHGHAHEHAHAIAGTEKLQFSSAVVAAMSGGIAPCPAAIVVLLTALRLHRVGYGIALIVVFSLGLAFVLSALGIAVVRGASWLRGRSAFSRAMRYAPLVTACVISIAGAAMVAQGFVAQGVRAPLPVVGALVLAAIAGYALVPRHSHGHDHDHAHGHTHGSTLSI